MGRRDTAAESRPALEETTGSSAWRADLQHPHRILLLSGTVERPKLTCRLLGLAQGFVLAPMYQSVRSSESQTREKRTRWLFMYMVMSTGDWRRIGLDLMGEGRRERGMSLVRVSFGSWLIRLQPHGRTLGFHCSQWLVEEVKGIQVYLILFWCERAVIGSHQLCLQTQHRKMSDKPTVSKLNTEADNIPLSSRESANMVAAKLPPNDCACRM